MNTSDRKSWESPGSQHAPEEEGPDAEEQMQQLRMQVARHKRGIQRKAERNANDKKPAIPQAGGAPLSSDVRGKMEGHLGGDLSAVRVHTSGESAKAATALGARAFTDGQDVHFNAGQFSPGSKEGDRLLAHELTHVVQGQKAGIQRKADAGEDKKDGGLEVSQPEDPAEQEADSVADGVAEKEHGDKKKDKKDKKKKDKKGEGEAEAAEGEGEDKADEKEDKGDEKAAAGPEEKPAAVSAKYFGVNRKVFRSPVTQIEERYPVGDRDAKTAEAGFDTDRKENPGFEADAVQFETKLGAAAFKRGAGVGAQVIGKVKNYLASKVDTTKIDNIEAETNRMMQTCLEASKMAKDPSFAGNVKPEQVQEIMLAPEQLKTLQEQIVAAKGDAAKLKDLPEPPNVREQMTTIYHFATNILTSDMLEAAGSKEGLQKLLANKAVSEGAIKERVQFMQDQGKERQKAGASTDPAKQKQMEGAGPGGVKAWDAVGFVPDPTKKDAAGKAGENPVKPEAGAPEAAGNARAVEGQWSSRENRNKVEGGEGTAKADQTPAADPDRSAGEVKDEGAGLSGREKEMQGLKGDEDPVKWSEGARMWIINEKDTWAKAMRDLQMPLAAGPSGTTNVLMNANAMLGAVPAAEMRMAAMGYLLPIHAHSAAEICAAAAAYGVPFEPGKKMYHHMPPMEEPELLEECGRMGEKAGKKLFPDEPDEAPQAPGGAGPTGPAPAQ